MQETDAPIPYDPNDPDDGPYDPNDDAAVDAFWDSATIVYGPAWNRPPRPPIKPLPKPSPEPAHAAEEPK